MITTSLELCSETLYWMDGWMDGWRWMDEDTRTVKKISLKSLQTSYAKIKIVVMSFTNKVL